MIQISETEFYIAIFFVVLASIEFLLILAIKIKTYGFEELKASLRKMPVVEVQDASGMTIQEVPVKSVPGYFVLPKDTTGKERLFGVSDGSAVTDKKLKVPRFKVYDRVGITVPVDWPAIIQELRESGADINNADEYALLCEIMSSEVKYKKFTEKLDKSIVEKLDKLKDQSEIKVKYRKTYRIKDLINFFPFNINPTFIEASRQDAVIEDRQKFNRQTTLTVATAMLIIMVLIGGAIAYKIMESNSNSETVNQLSGIVNNLQSTTPKQTVNPQNSDHKFVNSSGPPYTTI